MIEETVFTNETIIKTIKEKYDITIFSIEKLDRGSANLFSLNNKEYILKEFQSKYSEDEINKEIEIINHLKNDNILVPEYIPTIDNHFSFIYQKRVVVLQKYIDGYIIESNTGSYDQMIESAKVLGEMVKSLETLRIELPSNNVSSWYDLATLDESIQKHKDLLKKVDGKYKEKITTDLKGKISMLEYVKDNFNFEGMKNLTLMNTHGDYSVLQFIYKDNKIKAVIDFVAACKMPIVWEVIRSYSYIDSNAKGGRIDVNNLVNYVKEFSKYVKLNIYDIEYMPYLYLVQLLSSTFGYKQYIADNSKKSLLEFGFFRTSLCMHLFENAEFIANSLEKSIFEE